MLSSRSLFPSLQRSFIKPLCSQSFLTSSPWQTDPFSVPIVLPLPKGKSHVFLIKMMPSLFTTPVLTRLLSFRLIHPMSFIWVRFRILFVPHAMRTLSNSNLLNLSGTKFISMKEGNDTYFADFLGRLSRINAPKEPIRLGIHKRCSIHH